MNEPPTADAESRAVRAAAGPDQAGRRGQGEAEARPEFPVQLADEGARSLQVPRGPRLPRRVGVPPAQQIQRHVGGEELNCVSKICLISLPIVESSTTYLVTVTICTKFKQFCQISWRHISWIVLKL